MRADAVMAEILFNANRRKEGLEYHNRRSYSDIEGILTHNMKEYWRNVRVKTSVIVGTIDQT